MLTLIYFTINHCDLDIKLSTYLYNKKHESQTGKVIPIVDVTHIILQTFI